MSPPRILVLTANIGNYDRSIPSIPCVNQNVYLVNFQSSAQDHDDVSISGNSLSFSIRSSSGIARELSRVPKISPRFLFDQSVNPPPIFPSKIEYARIISETIVNPVDYVVWIDANCTLRSLDALQAVCSRVPAKGWGIYSHPDRDCLYREARAVKGFEYVNRSILGSQISYYRQQGVPSQYGLYSCNFIVRSIDSLFCSHALWDFWLSEFLRWVPRDQLSLPYSLFVHPCHRPTVLGRFSWANDIFCFNPH